MQRATQPLRLCYLGVAFRNQPDMVGLRRTEFMQAGVELLGLGGAYADAEVIALAASAMEQSGLKNFLIEVGQVDFFKGLMEEIGLREEVAEELRVAVEQKNVLQMEMLLRQEAMSEEAMQRIMTLPSLYGGAEVIEEALGMTNSARCRRALLNLREVYENLEHYGLAERVSIDLGMVQSIDYYSGVIFRGISGHLGAPILSGGRYDGLMDQFDTPTPATGFAMGVERLIEALERQGFGEQDAGCEVIVGCEKHDAASIAAIEALRAQGKRVVMFYEGNREALVTFAKERGARAVWVEEGGVMRE
jgi:ATP phosphoribosyltransferase regulatory subunit